MNDKNNAGYIIIVVTVILVALSLMGMTFLNLTSVDFTATDNYVNSLQSDMAARAGLDYATYVLKMDKYGTDTIVYNNNSYRYHGTSTLGYDENYDAYTEEWLGTGTGKIFCNATAASNDVDNNGDGVKDSKWLDAPFSLDRGLKAQYAILIEDVGESRINVNATGNVVGVAGSFVYGTGELRMIYGYKMSSQTRSQKTSSVLPQGVVALMVFREVQVRLPLNSSHAI